MPAFETGTPMRAAPRSRPDDQAASGGARAAGPNAGDDASQSAPRPEGTANGERRERGAEHGASVRPEVRLRDLLRGLRAGDLETVLLTVAMAADENRMPSADPDEEARILAFLARLAEHDAMLPPPPPEGSCSGPDRPSDPD
jgi:hypothetical protein